jgi:NMD protein affecting ribosome stability and mRNA decay
MVHKGLKRKRCMMCGKMKSAGELEAGVCVECFKKSKRW